MKKKTVILFVCIAILLIILGVAIIIVSGNLKSSDWHLRSWVIELAPYSISVGVMTLGILALIAIKNKTVKIVLSVLWILFCLGIIFIEFMLSAWFVKSDYVRKIDGKEYLGIDYYSNRLRKTVTYYEEYNAFAYHKTDEYIEEFYNYDDYEHPEYREYHKVPNTDSITYYYDKEGNVTEIKTYDEN